jgi:hypothetical protein
MVSLVEPFAKEGYFPPFGPLRQRLRGEQREAPPSRAALLTPNEALGLWRRTVGRDFIKQCCYYETVNIFPKKWPIQQTHL